MPVLTAEDLWAPFMLGVEQTAAEAHGITDPTGGGDGSPWAQDPVDLDTFVTGAEHLNLPPLYARQRSASLALLGADPKRIFEPPAYPEPVAPDWKKLRSSNLRGAAWEPGVGLLVAFVDGSVYVYPKAPKAALGQLRRASSPGRWIHAFRKQPGGRECARLDAAVDDVKVIREDPGQRRYQTAVLLWGKGSGKDYLCSILVCYLIHVLLCLRDPHGYFDLAPGENIDVVNVAYNADQARLVFFAKLKQRLRRWRWLHDQFNINDAGRRVNVHRDGRLTVEIKDNEVTFPRMIRAFSRHAQNEGYEGLNIIAWLMDEASAFLSKQKKENAASIEATLRTSASTRFGLRWLGFIISFPRHADDFTMKQVAAANRDPDGGIYADGPATTWEVNERTRDEPKVEVRPGFFVPISLANDFNRDFDDALSKICCQPPKSKDALFRNPERLHQAVARGRKPLIEWEPTETARKVVLPDGQVVQRRFAAIKLTRLGRLPKGTKMFFHGDPALTSDSFALGFGHSVPRTVVAYREAAKVLGLEACREQGLHPEQLIPWEEDVAGTVIDALLVWRPDPNRDVEVDLLNVKAVLLQVCKAYRIGGGTFDQWNSADTIQTLQARKVPVENVSWSRGQQWTEYRAARSAFYNDLVELPDDPTVTSDDERAPGVIYELERVEEIEGQKIDHPEGGSKDLADTVVRVIAQINSDPKRRFSIGRADTAAPEGDRLKGPQPTVNPHRTPTPITPSLREQEAQRTQERPTGVLEEGTGRVERGQSRLTVATVYQRGQKPKGIPRHLRP